jgi:uncharacterized DUF497 family protein
VPSSIAREKGTDFSGLEPRRSVLGAQHLAQGFDGEQKRATAPALPAHFTELLAVVTSCSYTWCVARFEWDEAKRKANVRKHGIYFVGAERVFDGYTVSVEDARFAYNEYRFITVGFLEGRVVAVAHTERGDVIRFISIRKATKNEQKSYFAKIPEW